LNISDCRKPYLGNNENIRYDLNNVFFFNDDECKEKTISKMPEASVLIIKSVTNLLYKILSKIKQRRFVLIALTKDSEYDWLKSWVYAKTGRTEVKKPKKDEAKEDENEKNQSTEVVEEQKILIKSEVQIKTSEPIDSQMKSIDNTKVISSNLAERKKLFFGSKRVTKKNFVSD